MTVMPTHPARLVVILVAVLGLLAASVTWPRPVTSASADVVINQLYAGGQSSQAPLRADYVELFNPGSAPVSLDGWSVQYAADDGATWRGTTLTGPIPAGGFYLVQGAVGEIGMELPTPDAAGTLSFASGSGRIALVAAAAPLTCADDPACATAPTVIDFVGYGPGAVSFEGTAPARSPGVERALLRDAAGCVDRDDNATDFLVRVPTPRNSAAPPEPCGAGEATPVGGTPVRATPVAGLVRIHDIQGAGHRSPLLGQSVVNVPGFVTALAGNRFWMQDPQPDADEATSEGILVFLNALPHVQVGDAVLVSGLVEEFRPGSEAGNLTTTEITEPSIQTVGLNQLGQILPTVLGPAGRLVPTEVIDDDVTGDVEASGTFDAASDGLDFWESLEGMLVAVDDAVVVGPPLGDGVIPVLASGGAGATGRTARGGVALRESAAGTDFNPERIILDDALLHGADFGDVDTGAHIPDPVSGVVDYGFARYRVLPTAPVTITPSTLQREATSSAGPNELAIATFNVENLAPNNPPDKFARLAEILVDNLASPDLVVLEEVQDNSGTADDGTVAADQTAATLITAITAAGGPVYQYREIAPLDGQDGGQQSGNIRVGFLFRTDRGLRFVDRPGGDATTAVQVLPGPQLSLSPGRIDPTNPAFTNSRPGFSRSRKPLVGEFTYQGHPLFVVGIHFNSKGGDDPLFGRRQPLMLESEAQRVAQAQVVRDFVDALVSEDPAARVIVLGDLNDFAFSPPVDLLRAGATPDGDLGVLIEQLAPEERYSYVFEGNSQALDQILVSQALSDVLVSGSYDVVHVNAEFAAQASDHDPQIARFRLLP